MPNLSAAAVLTPSRLLAAGLGLFILIALIDGLARLDNHNAVPHASAHEGAGRMPDL